ncbi:MAG: hypothetical protein Kow0062_25710 [Acidobacteriota bacterium]
MAITGCGRRAVVAAALLLLCSTAAGSAPAPQSDTRSSDPPRRFNVLVVPVDFEDMPGTLPPDVDSAWTQTLIDYFTYVSNERLDLHVHFVNHISTLGPMRLYRAKRDNLGHDCDGDGTVSSTETCDPCDETALLDLNGDGDNVDAQDEQCVNAWDNAGITARPGRWTPPELPIPQLLDAGLIDLTPDGLAPPGGGPADVFDGVFYVTVPSTRPDCGGARFTGWSINRIQIDGDPDHRYFVGVAHLTDRWPFCTIGAEDYGTAAHELGHTISRRFAHPAGYINGFDLMDSCNGCSPGIFTMSGEDVLGPRVRLWFPDWRDASDVARFVPPTGGTVVLAPIELDPDTTTSPLGLVAETGSRIYYVAECRRRIYPDAPPIGPDRREGVLVLRATPRADPPTQVMMIANGYDEDHDGTIDEADERWLTILQPGEEYADPEADMVIRAGPDVGDGCTVTVTYGPTATAPHPDLEITPWLTPPMYEYETIDLWVDSSCNGYEADDPSDPRRLREGRRGDAEQTVIGNGDAPCLERPNRVYARVRNIGSEASGPTTLRIEVTRPLGVGIREALGWDPIGTVTVPSLLPGEFADVFVEWTPHDETAVDTGLFAHHTCLRALIDPVAGELVTTNQDGVDEQENVTLFEMATPTAAEPVYEPVADTIFIGNASNVPRRYAITVDHDLPPGWSVDVGDRSRYFALEPGQTVDIPVSIEAADGTPVGGAYHARVTAYAILPDDSPDPENERYDSVEIGGVLLTAQTVLDTDLVVDAQADPPDRCDAEKIVTTGCLQPPPGGPAHLSVYYRDAAGATWSDLVPTDAAGCFTHEFFLPVPGLWTIRAYWPGDTSHASAVSPAKTVPAYAPGDMDCDEHPDALDNCPLIANPGQDDLDQDAHGDACDCDPQDDGTWDAPGEITGLMLPDGETLVWDPLADTVGPGVVYDVWRGDLFELPLRGASPGECLAAGLDKAETQDPLAPPSGEIRCYLVRARNTCGTGGWGESASGRPRRTGACGP